MRADEILARLSDEGVDIRHVLRHPHAPTGATLIMAGKGGGTARMAAAGANRLLLPAQVAAATELINRAGLVLAQLEVPQASVEWAFRAAHARGNRTMLDADPASPLSDDLLRNTDVIRANSEQASLIAGVPVTDESSAVAAARRLMSRGPRIAVMEAGNGANIVVESEHTQVFPHLPVLAVDSTSAGDALSATFAVSLLRGRSTGEAGFLANAAAAFATTRLGALPGMPAEHELRQFVDSMRGHAP